MNPTKEQQTAVNMAANGKDCKVTAYAGAGKTSTLKLIGNTLSPKNGMYLAFNKAIATEAQSKFDTNVNCRTFHSLAYTSVPRWLTAKLKNQRTMPNDLAKNLGLRGYNAPVSIHKQRTGKDQTRIFDAKDQANTVLKAIGLFCRSIDKTVNTAHVKKVLPDWIESGYAESMASSLLPHAQNYWQDILKQGGRHKLEHDHYLKFWALTDPVIRTDFILFDEAQDADPIMLDVLSRQNAQVVYVGDRHQQIYGFRGAVNAMQSLNIAETRLSQSFRFGQNIAGVANTILFNVLNENIPLRGLESIADSVGEISPKHADAFLHRTNASALNKLLELYAIGRRPKLEVDTATLKNQVEDAKRLQEGFKVNKGSIFDGFNSWPEVLVYVEELPQSDLTPLVSLINNYEVNAILHALDRSNDTDYDCVVSTAHKSKGLEFPKVILGDDFFWKKSPKHGEEIITQDEARLLYVAATRAQRQLDITNLEDLFQAIKPKKANLFLKELL